MRRAQTSGAFRAGSRSLAGERERTKALLLLLRVCLRSNLRRKPGRWPGVSPHVAEKANSVSPVPARIALRGGERAGADAICPCPSQEKRHFGDLFGR
jgi:hypothetical protein